MKKLFCVVAMFSCISAVAASTVYIDSQVVRLSQKNKVLTVEPNARVCASKLLVSDVKVNDTSVVREDTGSFLCFVAEQSGLLEVELADGKGEIIELKIN